MAGFMAILGASVDGLVMSPGRVVSTAQPALSLSMLAPKGPFGGSTADGEGWVGDRGRSAQVTKFEAGSDYLFFQGPAPKSAVQPDLPGLLTGVRTGHATRRLCHPHPHPHPHAHAHAHPHALLFTTHAHANPNPTLIDAHPNPSPNPCAGELRRHRGRARRADGSRGRRGHWCDRRRRPGAALLSSSKLGYHRCAARFQLSSTPRMRTEGAER